MGLGGGELSMKGGCSPLMPQHFIKALHKGKRTLLCGLAELQLVTVFHPTISFLPQQCSFGAKKAAPHGGICLGLDVNNDVISGHDFIVDNTAIHCQ